MNRWFDKINDNFTMIPNELIDGIEGIPLSDAEIIFVLKLLRHERNWIHCNKKTFSNISEKTIYRRKSDLIKKNVLKKTIIKRSFNEGIKTDGVVYDISPLEEFIYKNRSLIKEKIIPKKVIDTVITDENSIDEVSKFISEKINTFFDNLSEYKEQVLKDNYPKFFSLRKYIPTKKELSEWKQKKYSFDMFNYFDDYLESIIEQEDTFNGELIIPRLSLLLSNKVRFDFFNKLYKDKLGEKEMLSRAELNTIYEEPKKKEKTKKLENKEEELFAIIDEIVDKEKEEEDKKISEKFSSLDNIDEIIEELEKEGIVKEVKKETRKFKEIIAEREKNLEHALSIRNSLLSIMPKFEQNEFS